MPQQKWSAVLGIIVLLMLTLLSIGVAPALASARFSAGGNQGAGYDKPRWWSKLQGVSASTFAPKSGPASAARLSVGPNVDVSNEPGPQSETSIAVNPGNPSQLVAGSNEIFRMPMRAYFSSDGGLTWGGTDLPLPAPIVNSKVDFGSDPGVAWDTKGNAYYSYIVVFFNNDNFVAVTGSEMAVAKSSDGGHTWTSTYFALQTGQSVFNDKPMIAVDANPDSPFRDRVYVAWDVVLALNTAVGGLSSRNGIVVSYSADGGATFSPPVFASATGPGSKADIGADPFVAPDGTLHVAWHDIVNSRIAESSSRDGGLTFGSTHTIAATTVPYQVFVPAQNVRGALVYPAGGADISSSAYRGRLYVSWMDATANNGTDIFLSMSADGGNTWSAPLRVNDDAPGVANDQFNQWLAVDPTNGSVHLSWNDTRNDPSHVSTDIFYARSSNGGQTFSPNTQVTTAPTDETASGADTNNQYGDYEGIAAFNGVAHPVWTDRRAGVAALGEEVFTAAIKSK